MHGDPRERGKFNGEVGIAEAVDALYRTSAAPRDHDRLVALVVHQLRHVYSLGMSTGIAMARRKGVEEVE